MLSGAVKWLLLAKPLPNEEVGKGENCPYFTFASEEPHPPASLFSLIQNFFLHLLEKCFGKLKNKFETKKIKNAARYFLFFPANYALIMFRAGLSPRLNFLLFDGI